MHRSSQQRTELSELGEFGLIEHLTKDIKIKHPSTVKGAGDDAAVLDYKDNQVIVTTDLLIEGIHFDPLYTPLKHLGYKAVIVNLSDIYAMNATPLQILVSLGVSNRYSIENIDELYSGINLACKNYNVDLAGGDTSSTVSGMIISITAIGEAKKSDIVYRNTAKVNDLICVSGDLGGAYMGLQLLEREKEVFKVNPDMQPDFEDNHYILERQLKPEARKDIPDLFRKIKVKPTSMIDISDGLSSEVIHICKGSDKGCKVYEDKIPVHPETQAMAKDLNIDPTICALSGGEDYELLFTLKLKDHDKINTVPGISVIGHITNKNEGMQLVTRDGTQIKLTAQGWDALLR